MDHEFSQHDSYETRVTKAVHMAIERRNRGVTVDDASLTGARRFAVKFEDVKLHVALHDSGWAPLAPGNPAASQFGTAYKAGAEEPQETKTKPHR